MVRVRKLTLAIAVASALSSGMVHAFGLGEITLHSSLNQPLKAEVELLDVGGLSADEIVSGLASAEAFAKAGVDRQYFLTDLKFTPVIKEKGKSSILITSNKSVREPYLNFLMEVVWPSGRQLREYTLLLDPPLYSAQTTVAPTLPSVTGGAPSKTPDRQISPSRPTGSTSSARAPLSGEYRTEKNDTLWGVAQRMPYDTSVYQTMLAIQDLNPDAFVDGNINRMKAGQVLRLPDEQQIRSRTQAEAIAHVARQNEAWTAGRTGTARQIDATRRTGAGDAPANVESQDSLKLVSGEAGTASKGADTGSADSQVLSDELAVTQEVLDSTRRENEELQSRIEDLQSQLDKLQRLVELKDNQLARLQSNLAGNVDEGLDAQETSGESALESNGDISTEIGEEPTMESGSGTDTPVAPVVEEPEESAAPVTPPAPVEKSFLGSLFESPLLMVAGGLAALLALGAWVFLRRKSQQEQQEEEGEVLDIDESEEPEETDDSAPELDSFDNVTFDAPVEEPVGETPIVAETAHESERQPTDALEEADIYVAYGRFTQAIELLKKTLKNEPERLDLRLKLLDIYAETGSREAFSELEAQLQHYPEAATQIEQLKDKYPGVFVQQSTEGNDFPELSLDDLTLESPAFEQVSLAPEEQVDLSSELDDSFDLSLSEEAVPEAEFALDLPFDDEAELSAELPVVDEFELGLDDSNELSPVVEDDFTLDLDALGSVEQSGPVAEPEEEPVLGTAPVEAAVKPEPLVNLDSEDDFGFLAGMDEISTKLDLAQAYIDMGDAEGARDILEEVIAEGNGQQQQEARKLLDGLS